MSRIEPLSQVQKGHIQEVLAHAKGDLALACRILGVSAEDLTKLLATHGLGAPALAANPSKTPEEE
ncbi:MAG: helix-turn-helix domain-containing protein [Pseudomonadota bacterium]